MNPSKRFGASRRSFIKTSAVAAFGFQFVPSRVWGANERLRLACIGTGGKGEIDIIECRAIGDIVGLCDIDEMRLSAQAAKNPKAKTFHDFRKMLEELDKEIDAVTVSTPDHTHAPASLLAMKMGKHVHCQKPLTHDVHQARLMRDTARERKVATQMGNQGTAEDGLRTAVEIIRSGGIGPVREAHVWTNRPHWPQAPSVTSRPRETPAVPPHIHWDLFLGPAPERPYHPAYLPFKWRGWWDFGTGALGDMGCHTANMPFMALNLQAPTAISAESGEVNSETYPGWATVTFEFPARGEMPPVKLIWHEGKLPDGTQNLPSLDFFHGEKPVGSGSLLIGSKGVLYSPDDYGARFKLLPSKSFEGFQNPPQTIPRNGMGELGMKMEWAKAIRGGPKAMSNFDYASALTETILLGNVGIRAGRRIEWDTEKLRVTNYEEMNRLIHPEYRPGWM